MIASSSLALTSMRSVRVLASLALVHLPRQPVVVMTGHRAMYPHVSMMAIDLSGAACAARRRAVFHALGVKTMRHRLVFPPVLTRDKRRAIARKGACVMCCDHCDLRHTASNGARQARDNNLAPHGRGLAAHERRGLQVARRAKGVYNASPSCEGRESRSRCITATARYRAQGGAGGAGTGRLDRGHTHFAMSQWI